jgi:cyclic pyranopterin phosphate synthase
MMPAPAISPSPVTDSFGRVLRYLRLSITGRCNLRCTYCVPSAQCPSTSPGELPWDDLLWMVRTAAEELGITSLRLTGGEPTLRPGLAPWIRTLADEVPSLTDIALTTNGILLHSMAASLAGAGLHRVNVSLDSLDPDRFRRITRGGDLQRVLDGIKSARARFRRVKINTVALREGLLDELPGFVALSDREEIEVRFIEAMPIGNSEKRWRESFVSAAEIRQRLLGHGYELLPSPASTGAGPATTWAVSGTRARIGFISQVSCTSCASCNRLRITSDGCLRPCLLSSGEIPLRAIIAARNADSFLETLRTAFQRRPADYRLSHDAASPPQGRMQSIGG